jgi:PDZ domain
MSNPFDSFAADFQAALPPGAPGAAPPAAAPGGYNPNASFMAQPPQPPVMQTPVMNSPVGYGAPPQQGGYGQPQYGMPPQQQPPMQSMGASFSSGMMAPPPASSGYGGFDQSSSSLAMSNPYGSPPPAQYAPPVDNSNPFGAPMAGPPDNSYPPLGSPAAGSMADASNPFGAPVADNSNQFGSPAPPAPAYGAPPAQLGYGAPPPADQGSLFGAPPAGQEYGSPQPSYAPPMDAGYGMPTQLGQQVSSGYGMPPADPGFGAPPPPQDQGYGAPPPAQPQYADPWGSPGGAPPPADPYMGALVPAHQQSNPYAAYGAPPPPQDHGYGAPPPPQAHGYGAPPPPPQQQVQQYQGPPPGAHDPYGAPAYGAPPQHSQAVAPYGAPAADPFSVFEQRSAPPPPPAPMYQQQEMVPYQPATAAPSADNLWGDLGFDAPPVAETHAPAPLATIEAGGDGGHSDEKKTGDGSLPPGGEYYDARIFTPTLGVMFFKPQELTDSLFLNTDQSIVDTLAERPVVAFIVEGSSARAAGVELGHVLLKVNGVDVKNPKEASRLIKEGPRPLPLLFYVPNTDVVVAEGEHMVKYDTRDTMAPNSAKDWKPKYVVIGGIIAQPWMMNMYRSKVSIPYDNGVLESSRF